MSTKRKAVEKKTPPAARIKKKGTGPPRSTPTTSAMHERATEIDPHRERAVILDTLAEVCLEPLKQTEYDPPNHFVRQTTCTNGRHSSVSAASPAALRVSASI